MRCDGLDSDDIDHFNVLEMKGFDQTGEFVVADASVAFGTLNSEAHSAITVGGEFDTRAAKGIANEAKLEFDRTVRALLNGCELDELLHQLR